MREQLVVTLRAAETLRLRLCVKRVTESERRAGRSSAISESQRASASVSLG